MCSSVGIFIFARLLLSYSCFAASNLRSFCFILYVRTFLPSFSFFFRSSLLEFIALFFHFAFSAVNAQVHCHIFYSYTGLFFDCASCLLVLRALAPLALASLCICSFVLRFIRFFIAVAASEDRFCQTRSVLAFCGIYPFFVKLTAGFAIALRIHLSLWDICFLMA